MSRVADVVETSSDDKATDDVVAELIRRTRAESGVPERIEDPIAIATTVEILTAR